MLSCFGVSVVFLVCYVSYHQLLHAVTGERGKPFEYPGTGRPILLLRDPDQPRRAGGHRPVSGELSRFTTACGISDIRPHRTSRAVDVSDLAVCFDYGGRRLPDAISLLPRLGRLAI